MSIHKITQTTRTTRVLEVFENIGVIEDIPFSSDTLAHSLKQVNRMTD